MIKEIINTIKETAKKDRAKEKKQNEEAKKKCDALSLQDRYYYGTMVKESRTSWITFLTFPFYFTFYFGLFALIAFVAFNINLKEPALILIGMLFRLYPIWLTMFIVFELLELIEMKKFKLKLLGIK